MVTIKDIAKKLGLSPATVSKALNGYTDISPQTAKKIRETAQEMHYLPNIAARQLKTNVSHNIGVLFVDERMCGLTHEYFSGILNSAKEELESLGYDITFISSSIAGVKSTFLEHARYRNCDGILIACVDFESRQVRDLVESGIPTVTIDYSYPQCSSVMSDNVEGSYELTKHLLEMGHRKIALIHGELTMVTKKRLNGFYRAMREYRVEVPEEYIYQGIYHDADCASEATKKLMALKDRPTAIMYQDDFSALGGITRLEKMGISIPDEISITGYDGIPLSQVLRPRLTTWYQSTDDIGRSSARKLVETIEDARNSVPEQLMVRGKLLMGNSVKKLHITSTREEL